MPEILKEKALWFNDVVLVPQRGKVRSRKNIPRELHRFIVSPMTSVVGQAFAREATDLGLTVCIPRFLGAQKEVEIFYSCPNKDNLFCSMGLNDLQRIKVFKEYKCKNYLIDIANGYMPHIDETVKLLCDNVEVERLILGNITTRDGGYYLRDIVNKICPYIKELILRCGISNGSGCETYSTTGYGSGQLTELLEMERVKTSTRLNINYGSDGGLKDGGFVNKAFFAGADYVFIGGMFARAKEAETNISGDGSYYGLASDKNQIISKGKKYRHAEGKEYLIPKEEIRPLVEIVDELWGCVSSAVSYSGYLTLKDAIGKGVFQIKQNSLPSRKRFIEKAN